MNRVKARSLIPAAEAIAKRTKKDKAFMSVEASTGAEATAIKAM